MKIHQLLFLPLVMLFAGCAVGNKYSYNVPEMALPVTGTDNLGIAVLDEREYVKNGDKKPSFVGLQRGGFGNPFDVTTASGRPLVDDIADSIASSLRNKGFSVEVIPGNQQPADLASYIEDAGLDACLILQVKEWKTDVFMTISLHYDLHLVVYGPDGEIVAQTTLAEAGEPIAGAKLGQAANAVTAQAALEQKISYLFANPEIRQALGR